MEGENRWRSSYWLHRVPEDSVETRRVHRARGAGVGVCNALVGISIVVDPY